MEREDAEDSAQLVAKLRGLERMHLAGLLSDAAYQGKLRELRAKLTEAGIPLPADASAELQAAPAAAPPEAPVPAPPPLVVGAEVPAPLLSTPAPAAPRAASRTPELLGTRGVLVAAIVTAAVLFIIATFAVLTTRNHSSNGAPPLAISRSTATPDADVALAALRTASPSLPDVVMDASDAEKLVRAFWPARERALSTRDPRAVRLLETGAAAQWDAVGCTMGCAPPRPRTIQDLNVFVPRQTTYPAAFMAQVLTTEYHSSTALVEIMVFTRASSSQPWSLAFDTAYTGSTRLGAYPASIDGGAFNADAPEVDGTASSLPAELAAYWQHWVDSGSAPADTRFADGSFTSVQGAAIHEARLERRADGIAENVTYTPDTAGGVWSFAVNREGGLTPDFALTCGTVRYVRVATSTRNGGTLVQDLGFQPFGTLLRPGAYASVTEQGLRQSCFLTRAGSRDVDVIGVNGQTTAITAVIAHAQT